MTRLTRDERGFTLTEMLVASAIMLTVTGAVFSLMNPAHGTFQSQPEIADMQQRLRVGVDTLSKDIVMAGAGTYTGVSAGALYNFFAPVLPYRRGDLNDDAAAGVFYRPDTISLLYVPPTPAQTRVNQVFGGGNSQEIDVEAQLNCGPDIHTALCGFDEQYLPMRALIMDPDSGAWDTITVTQAQDEALHLQFRGEVNQSYNSGNAVITQVATHTYYLKTSTATKTYQLMHYDGALTDAPVVDNVVKLEFEYFGEPQPPQLLPNKALSDKTGPWTTYGPKPPALASTLAGWPAGENCVFKMVEGKQVPRLQVLADGVGQVKLDPAILQDGPWCPNVTSPNRFDADLLRIRRVRAKVRVQVGLDSMRGPAGVLFTRGGTSNGAERFVPDQEVSVDVTPRNMNLGR
jgi:prepilin-type N-terminal cleavage/methylation domain-containing protein